MSMIRQYLPVWAQDWLGTILPGLHILLILIAAWLLRVLVRRVIRRAHARYNLPAEILVGSRRITASGCCFGERVERAKMALLAQRALRIHPSLELGGLAEVNAVQHWSAVQSCRVLPALGADGLVERPQVHAHESRVEAQVRRARRDRLVAELASRGVEELVERVARPCGIALRPQVRLDPLPR